MHGIILGGAEAWKGKQVQLIERRGCWWVVWGPRGGGDAEPALGAVKGRGRGSRQRQAGGCEDPAAETGVFQEQHGVLGNGCRGTDSHHGGKTKDSVN